MRLTLPPECMAVKGESTGIRWGCCWRRRGSCITSFLFRTKNLLTIDLSHVLLDLVQVDDRLQRMLRYSLETFLRMEKEKLDAA
jgi:hypothetical protein